MLQAISTVTSVAQTHLTRAVLVPLDPTPAQEQLLRSYCGAARTAHNWIVDEVKSNLQIRRQEKDSGKGENDLTPTLSWSYNALSPAWNRVKAEVAPCTMTCPATPFIQGLPPRPKL